MKSGMLVCVIHSIIIRPEMAHGCLVRLFMSLFPMSPFLMTHLTHKMKRVCIWPPFCHWHWVTTSQQVQQHLHWVILAPWQQVWTIALAVFCFCLIASWHCRMPMTVYLPTFWLVFFLCLGFVPQLVESCWPWAASHVWIGWAFFTSPFIEASSKRQVGHSPIGLPGHKGRTLNCSYPLHFHGHHFWTTQV